MILSRGRNYLFLHIPKTGGTALALALEARAMKDDILVGDTPKARARARRQKRLQTAGRLWKHSTLADLDGLVTTGDLDRLFILTLVRNPWDRAVSYYHWLRAQSFAHAAVELARNLTFRDFLAHPLTENALSHHPAASWTRDRGGQDRATLCLRLEYLDHDIAPFEAHLGFSLAPIARANPSERDRDWRRYYDDENAARLAKICAEDISRFGYGFDDFDEHSG
ncbi:MAG: sulfotransferase family 2 domain-containing protein [Pseudorhodobacter sp.]